MQAKHIGDYLAEDRGTSRLVPQVATLLAIRQRLTGALPDSLRRSCAIANYKHGIVVLLASNNAVAAKLRLIEPRLVNALSNYGLNVTGIKIQVQGGASFPMQVTEKKALSLSLEAADALARLSVNLPESRLKRAVDALANSATKPGISRG
jgi:hypothetical protein